MQAVIEFIRTHRKFLAVGLALASIGTVGAWQAVRSVQADRQPVPSQLAYERRTDLGNAPEAVQACFAERAGSTIATELLAADRPLTEAERATLNDCFRDVTVPSDAHPAEPTVDQSASTLESPAASSPPKAAITTQTSRSSASPTTSSNEADESAAPSSAATSAPPPDPLDDVHPQVWSKNGYDGASYEYKVNCGPNHTTLEDCFLWDLTKVTVTAPGGTVYELTKDFNVNSYSGEVTRRWVLYGPANGGLPASGQYVFNYWRGDTVVEQEAVDYAPQVIGAPTTITWRREGNDLVVDWEPPAGMAAGMSYKVIIFRPKEVLSQLVTWDARSARLANLPLAEGESVTMNVSSYFSGGYAYPESVPITW